MDFLLKIPSNHVVSFFSFPGSNSTAEIHFRFASYYFSFFFFVAFSTYISGGYVVVSSVRKFSEAGKNFRKNSSHPTKKSKLIYLPSSYKNLISSKPNLDMAVLERVRPFFPFSPKNHYYPLSHNILPEKLKIIMIIINPPISRK